MRNIFWNGVIIIIIRNCKIEKATKFEGEANLVVGTDERYFEIWEQWGVCVQIGIYLYFKFCIWKGGVRSGAWPQKSGRDGAECKGKVSWYIVR